MRPPVGIGLRHPHYAEVLETRPALDFLEVHSENFFGDGGAALAVLAEARGHYAISLHGVGLALGSATFLWLMAGLFDYDTKLPAAPNAVHGYVVSSSIITGLIFLGAAIAIAFCTLTKEKTLKMAAELAERRKAAGVAV